MPAKTNASRSAAPKHAKPMNAEPPISEQVTSTLAALERMATRKDRDNLTRFGITAQRPLGVSLTNMHVLAKRER